MLRATQVRSNASRSRRKAGHHAEQARKKTMYERIKRAKMAASGSGTFTMGPPSISTADGAGPGPGAPGLAPGSPPGHSVAGSPPGSPTDKHWSTLRHLMNKRTLAAKAKLRDLEGAKQRMHKLERAGQDVDVLVGNAATDPSLLESSIETGPPLRGPQRSAPFWHHWAFAVESLNRESSSARRLWNIIVTVLIMYSVVVIPFRLGFELQSEGALFYAEVLIVDSLFALDMVINFFTHRDLPDKNDASARLGGRSGQLSGSSEGRRMARSLNEAAQEDEDGNAPWAPFALRDTCRRDATHYLRTWFFVDLFSTVPFDLILLAALGTAAGLRGLKLVRTLRLARLLKLVRVFKLKKMISRVTSPSTNLVATAMVRLGRIISVIFLTAHILSCVFHYLSVLETDGGTVASPTWFNSVDKPAVDMTHLGNRYLLSLYWVVATLMAVGYGDLHAITTSERAYSIFTQVVGAVFFGIIVAHVAQLLETLNARNNAFSRRLDEVREYMLDRKLPQTMQRRILDYFTHFLSQKSLFNEAEILGGLSKSLRNEVVSHGMGEAMAALSALNGEDASLVTKLVTRFKPAVHMPGDMIGEEGDIGREMFFLTKGTVDVIAELPDDFLVLPDFSVQPLERLGVEDVRRALRAMPGQKAKHPQPAANAQPGPQAGSDAAAKPDGSVSGIAKQMSVRSIGSYANMSQEVPLPQPCLLLGMYTEGRQFGDISVMLEVRRPVGYRASVVCNLQALAKQDLELILYDYPDAYQRLRSIAETRARLWQESKERQILRARSRGLREVSTSMPHIQAANDRAKALYLRRKADADKAAEERSQVLARRARAVATAITRSSRNLASAVTRSPRASQVGPEPAGGTADDAEPGIQLAPVSARAESRTSAASSAEAQPAPEVAAAGSSASGSADAKLAAARSGSVPLEETAEDIAMNLADARKLENIDTAEGAAAAKGLLHVFSQAKMVMIPAGAGLQQGAGDGDSATGIVEPESQDADAPRSEASVRGDDEVSPSPAASDTLDDSTGAGPASATILLNDEVVAEEDIPDGLGVASETKGVTMLRVLKRGPEGDYECIESEASLRRRLVLHAGDILRVRYDMLMAVLIVVTLVEVPFVIGFAVDESVGLTAFDSLVDAAFLVDLVSSFRSAFVVEDSDALNTIGPQMAWNYFRGNFGIDFLSSMPFDTIISAAIGGSGAELRSLKLLRTVRLVRLLKLFRFFRLRRLIQSLTLQATVPPAIVQLVKVAVQVTLGAHVLACVFFFVSIAGTNDRTEAAAEDHWWTATTPNDLGQQYLAALYFAFTTMTTVGYGDLVPRTVEEIVVTVFAMLIGATVFGYIVGSVAHLVARLDASGMRYQAKMSEVLEYLHDKGAPKRLARRVIRYYDYYLSRKSAFDEDVILEELSDTLRREVVLFINMDIIRRVPYFFHKDREFVTLLVSLLRPQFVYPGAFLYSEGEMASEMFFLIKGQVEIVSAADTAEEHRYALLEPGSYFGELALLMGIRRSSSARALTHANLFVLTKDDLRSTVAYYPQLAEKMEESLRTTLDKLTKGSLKARKSEERKQARGIAANFVSTLMRDVQSKEMSVLASHVSRADVRGSDAGASTGSTADEGSTSVHATAQGAEGSADGPAHAGTPASGRAQSADIDAIAQEELGGRTRSAGDDEAMADVTGERGTVGNGVAGEEWKADIREYLVERAASVLPGDDGDEAATVATAAQGAEADRDAKPAGGDVGKDDDDDDDDDDTETPTRHRRMSVELSKVMRSVARLPELPEEDAAEGDAEEAEEGGPGAKASSTGASSRTRAASQPDTAAATPASRGASSRDATAAPGTSALLSPSLRPDERTVARGPARPSKRASMPPLSRSKAGGGPTAAELRHLESLLEAQRQPGGSVSVPAAVLQGLLRSRRTG